MPFEYRKSLSNLMSTVISGVCSELGLPFGGGTNRSLAGLRGTDRRGMWWSRCGHYRSLHSTERRRSWRGQENDGRVSQDGVLYSVLLGILHNVLQTE